MVLTLMNCVTDFAWWTMAGTNWAAEAMPVSRDPYGSRKMHTPIPNNGDMLIREIDPLLPTSGVDDFSLECLGTRDLQLLRIDQTPNSRDQNLTLLDKSLLRLHILKTDKPCLSRFTPRGTGPLHVARKMLLNVVLFDDIGEIPQNLRLRRKHLGEIGVRSKGVTVAKARDVHSTAGV
jgi:hypothetical protein